MAKLACTGCVCDAVSVPLFGDTLPAFLFRLDLHHACGDDADAWGGRVVNVHCCLIGGGPHADLRLALWSVGDIISRGSIRLRETACSSMTRKLVAATAMQ